MTEPIASGPIHDQRSNRIPRHRQVIANGRIFDLVSEEVELTPGHQVRREFIQHPGAVAIIAIDDHDRVLLQRQYRHPVRSDLWEPPAGLLDIAGELPLTAARRELAEEADLLAGDWRRLTSFFTSPGGSSEQIRVFLARQLSPVPSAQRFQRQDEEIDLTPAWIPLSEAADLVLAGALTSPTAAVGILAAARAATKHGGFDALEPAYE